MDAGESRFSRSSSSPPQTNGRYTRANAGLSCLFPFCTRRKILCADDDGRRTTSLSAARADPPSRRRRQRPPIAVFRFARRATSPPLYNCVRAPHAAACSPQSRCRVFRRCCTLASNNNNNNNIVIVVITTMFEIYSSDTEEQPLNMSAFYGRKKFCEYMEGYRP